jgi:CRP-like cAMP-binding protein
MARNRSQPEVITANQKNQPVDWEALLAGFAGGKTDVEYGANRNIFCQGQPADSVFYIRQGKVKCGQIIPAFD